MSRVVELGAVVALAAGCEKNITDKDIKAIDTAELRRLTLKAESGPHAVLLIDPRAAKAFEAGHLPRARNIELASFDRDGRRKKWIDAYDEIVVYGDDPGSSVAKAMTKRLLHLDYDDVRMYFGGVVEWQKAGFPIETGPRPTAEDASAKGAASEPAAKPAQ